MKRVVVEDSGDSGSEDIENQEQIEDSDCGASDNAVSDDENDSMGEDDDRYDDLASNEDESGVESGLKNAAWADSVSKILKSKPKANKPLVLSKAKKLTDIKPKPKEAGFQVVLEDGKVKNEVVEEAPATKKEKTKKKEKRKKEIVGLRVKPDIMEKDRERVLLKIATRGVVQLFNAVRTQQKDISKKLDEAGPLEVRKEKVMKSIDKNAFLDVLMGQKSQKVDDVLEKGDHIPKKRKLTEKEESSGKVWDVLKDNYMLDAKLKDWDKELEIEEEMEDELEMA